MTIYFVATPHRKREKWNDLETLAADGVDVDEIHDRLITGVDAWIFQSFLILKEPLRAAGIDVRFSRAFVPGALCVAHRDDLKLKARFHRSYVVAVRADRPRALACQLDIVQNRTMAKGKTTHFLPHWPQPGLVPRDPARGARLARLGYFGRTKHLPPEFLADRLRNDLARRGVEFVVREQAWNDYSDIDAVVAVRKVPRSVLLTKPASKLVNAWQAGVPALLGREPAYDEIRTSPLDYLEVESPESVLEAVERLRDFPSLYESMVRHGHVRGEEYSREKTAGRWVRFLSETAIPSYTDWLRWDAGGYNPVRLGGVFARLACQKVITKWFWPKRR
jgi:hypothetical protein